MNDNYENIIVKSLVDVMVFLEFSDDESINPDMAIKLLEGIGAELTNLDNESKKKFVSKLKEISQVYPQENRGLLLNCLKLMDWNKNRNNL